MDMHYLVVFSNPVEGREDEYNDWYTNTHLHDVMKIPGFVAARRFKLSDGQLPVDTPYKYMAIYEIEADDIKSSLDALIQASTDGSMEISSTLDMSNLASWAFTPITERV